MSRSPVKYIWTAGTRNQGLNSQAIVAKAQVLSVAQTGRYQCNDQPVKLLSVTTLNVRIRNVAQILDTRPIAGEARYQPGPTTRRRTARQPARSSSQSPRWRGSL